MASFGEKIRKTFLTLLLMVGVFFAGCIGLAPTNKASAVFADTQIGTEVIYADKTIFTTYAEDILVGVDTDGYIYRATDGTANLVKTGVQVGKIEPTLSGYGDPNRMFDGLARGNYIAYNNGTIVIISGMGSRTVYYSNDLGVTWLSSNVEQISSPTTIIAGADKFIILAYSHHTSYSEVNLYASVDGITWNKEYVFTGYAHIAGTEKVGYNTADQLFKYNSGHYIKTTAYDATELDASYNNILIQVSVDLKNWINIPAPYQATADDYLGAGVHTTAFMVDNVLYCYQYTNNFSRLYSTTTLSENATWKLIKDDCEHLTNVVPYANGVIACVDEGGNESYIEYFEITENGITNVEELLLDPNALDFTGEKPEILQPDTITIGKNYLCVGFSGQSEYGAVYRAKNACFVTYERNPVHTVKFIDWNGNVITQSDVADGQTVIAPANPTREGYNFVGWDYDLTQPVTNNLVITAQYEIKTYTIQFLDWNGQFISSVTKEHGSVLKDSDIPTPVRDAYSFTGWDKDTALEITSNLTFIAQYSRDLTITINYLQPHGTAGLVNQFTDMRPATKVFNYVYGDIIANDELEQWYNSTILPWQTDYSADGVYNYTYMLTGWDKELPSKITNNIIVNATYEELNIVTLAYYSQLRFLAYEEADGTDYYYTFIGYMTVDKLMADGEVINLEDFKNPDANYHIYNANKNTFYNNLEYFEFLGWDKDITKPITEDTKITAQYNLPKVQLRLFDSDNYFIGKMYQEISFMTIEDLQALEGSSSKWDKFREGFRLFFSLQWGDLGGLIADSIDFSRYLKEVKQYHTADCQILTAFVCVNTDYPEYGGVFKNGLVSTSSPVLEYYTGTANENNMSFWINPIMFATTLYPLTCVVSYSHALGSIVKTVTTAVTRVWDVVSEYWWVILLVVLVILFRKPLIAGLTMLFGAIKKGTQKLSAKIKSKSKNSEYKKAEKEYSTVKKQSKKKEK